ncbi:MAG: hypothetical protein M5U26_02540 [Planctomycetota bacterium]|nr:hypothetical protein [Planctomycetota bacterium]
MLRYNLYVRNLFLKPAMAKGLEDHLTDEADVAPGQLRLREDWYYLTYLRVMKVRNFDPALFELTENEVQSIRVTAFRIRKSKLLVRGSKAEIKEIQALLEALALQVSGNAPGTELDHQQYFRIDPPEVDLGNVLKHYEDRGMVENVRKLRIKDLQVKLGSVRTCLIDTDDYGGVRKLLGDVDNKAVGVELKLRDPEQTFLYVDIEGQVKIATGSVDNDLDLEKMAEEVALRL